MPLSRCFVLPGSFFYYAHRMLHNRWFYQRVHKVHHQVAPSHLRLPLTRCLT